MAHRSLRNLVIVTLFSLSAIAVGCGNSVGGGDGGGGSGGGSGGTGGSGDTCTTEGASQSCNGGAGFQQCVKDSDGNLTWNECQISSTQSTPLVLSFDGAPVDFAAGNAAFDVDGTMSVVTDWPAARTPWLALDRNGNGSIDDGSELFGSMTVLSGGARATNGFAALAELDSNGDGRITPEDAAWGSLRLWSDGDGDRVSSARELGTLDARGVVAIDLGYTVSPRCDLRHNCEMERASFRWVDVSGVEHTGAVVDVHLKHQ